MVPKLVPLRPMFLTPKMGLMIPKLVPLRPIFGVRNSQKALGVRSGEHGGWVMTQQAMCGLVRYRDAATTVPACHVYRTRKQT
jgi:hypothetical protein